MLVLPSVLEYFTRGAVIFYSDEINVLCPPATCEIVFGSIST